jgi:hypothetical protein
MNHVHHVMGIIQPLSEISHPPQQHTDTEKKHRKHNPITYHEKLHFRTSTVPFYKNFVQYRWEVSRDFKVSRFRIASRQNFGPFSLIFGLRFQVLIRIIKIYFLVCLIPFRADALMQWIPHLHRDKKFRASQQISSEVTDPSMNYIMLISELF